MMNEERIWTEFKGFRLFPFFPESQWPPVRPSGWRAEGPRGGIKAKAKTKKALKRLLDDMLKGKKV